MVPRRPQHTPHWKARHYALCWRAGRSGSDKTSAAPTLQQEDHHHHHQHSCRVLMQPNHPFHSSFIHLPPVHSSAAFRLSTCAHSSTRRERVPSSSASSASMMPRLLLLLALVALCSAAPRDPHIIALDEKSVYLEADILPDKEQVQNKMAVRDNHRLWPGGRLLYELAFDTENNPYVRDLILSAVDEINAEGCVTLAAASRSDVDHVSIHLGSDYSSHFGRQGGTQNLTVVAETIHRGSVMHELMHALGFGHEHNRPDRDDYVVIDFGNIQDAAKPYFKKYTPKDPVKDEQLAYDYLSLMHATDMYDDRVNIDTSKPVIWRKDGGQDLGQRSMLTPLDKQRLRKIYSCEVCQTETANNKLFRYPGDCSKYISCSNTFPYVMNCPSGLHFSLDYNRCEYPITANCTNLTSV